MPTHPPHERPRKGRGATLNLEGRFASCEHTRDDDGWGSLDEPLPPLETVVQPEAARSIVSRNDSPDLPFTQSINPYRGCEHGCVYCYARPSHAYVDLSPGLDFETKLFYKRDAAARLAETFRRRGYRPSPIMLGANTDAYQPIERELRVTRSILEVMRDFRHPVAIITKSALVLRDVDLLAELAADDLVQVTVSITTLDAEVKRTLEPRAAGPAARLRAVRELRSAGVPTGVMIAPVIPAITDHEIERIVAAAADAGAERAGYVMLRLPYEVKTLFRAWLEAHYPQRAAHVMSLVHEMRGGRDNDPRFGTRMRGEGAYAELIARRFRVACRRHGLPRAETRTLRTDLFAPPARRGDQLDLLT
ncbi:MAG TPA: PA0069 family radical SAM protein [Gammaproteobacteria bacterium]